MIQQIVQLNNTGVSFLASGETATAMKVFKSALVLMGQEAEAQPCEDFMSTEPLTFGPSVEVPGLEDPYFFVYNQAMQLNASETDLTWANSCLLFNMALTFHLKGVGCRDVAKLQKALRIYDLAAQLIFEAGPSAATLALAALNNQAAICYSLGDYAQSQERLEQVRESADLLITSPMEEEDGTPITGPLEQRCLDEICLNVAIVEPPTMAPSA